MYRLRAHRENDEKLHRILCKNCFRINIVSLRGTVILHIYEYILIYEYMLI